MDPLHKVRMNLFLAPSKKEFSYYLESDITYILANIYLNLRCGTWNKNYHPLKPSTIQILDFDLQQTRHQSCTVVLINGTLHLTFATPIKIYSTNR